jgi:cell division protein FtsB
MVEARSRKERLEAKGRRVKAKLLQEILVPERIILSIIPFILILWLVGSITNLSRNWSLQQEVNERKAELAYLELQVDSYELENQYYSSEEYQELAARRLQNKILKGETLVYLPSNSERAKRRHRDATDEEKRIKNEKTNFDQWLSFLFNL